MFAGLDIPKPNLRTQTDQYANNSCLKMLCPVFKSEPTETDHFFLC